MGRISRARKLRREMSPPERRLWRYLRMRPDDLKFRRQHPLGPYTADFYCCSAGVVIEVDGDVHDMGDNPERDARRDAALAKRGIVTLRFLAADIFKQLDAVLVQIEDVCTSRRAPE
jgi:very-short-patch-repair endonuclease